MAFNIYNIQDYSIRFFVEFLLHKCVLTFDFISIVLMTIIILRTIVGRNKRI